VLRGDRIILAPLRDEDSRTLFDWINERDDVLLSAPYKPVHAADHRDWFDAIRSRQDVAIFGIRLLDDDRLIGSCQLYGIDPRARSAELQIRIGEADARDQGLGTEAVQLLLRHAFADLNLHRVQLRVFASNERAQGAYERAGFRHEGTLRDAAYVDGAWDDVVVMGLLRDEWRG
jgi:RimJ/RimL family protein N-acetyltransferase